jgi:hypothetical protein
MAQEWLSILIPFSYISSPYFTRQSLASANAPDAGFVDASRNFWHQPILKKFPWKFHRCLPEYND